MEQPVAVGRDRVVADIVVTIVVGVFAVVKNRISLFLSSAGSFIMKVHHFSSFCRWSAAWSMGFGLAYRQSFYSFSWQLSSRQSWNRFV